MMRKTYTLSEFAAEAAAAAVCFLALYGWTVVAMIGEAV